jgi:hypothetical protein
MNHRKPLLIDRTKVKNPTGIVEAKPYPLKGDWWLTMPQSSRDVAFLQMLAPGQRYASYEGNGILVADEVIPNLQ